MELEYLLLFRKLNKIHTVFHPCLESEKDERLKEFKEHRTFRGEHAESMFVFLLSEIVEAPGR